MYTTYFLSSISGSSHFHSLEVLQSNINQNLSVSVSQDIRPRKLSDPRVIQAPTDNFSA